MRKLSALILYTLFVFFIQTNLQAASGQELEKGKIIDKVICQWDPSQSYALYLPSKYTPEKKWPILYALDPGARGKVPLEHFQAAAEKYNLIVAGSNNARNGPWEPVVQAVLAIWYDTNTRLSIESKRIYVTGFSGGSRAASLFPNIIKRPVAGIIGCGAGLATGVKPEEIAPAFYHGVVGIEDFNYLEMANLAVRVLFCLEMDSRRMGGTYLQKSDPKRAILFFEITVKASLQDSPRLKYNFYNLACAYARGNYKKKALKNLKLAVENGFNDAAYIEQDEDLKSIKGRPEFLKIIETLKQK